MKKTILILSVIFSASLAVLSIPVVSSALTASDPLTYPEEPATYAKKWTYYRAVAGCYAKTDVGKTSYTNVDEYNWFDKGGANSKTYVGYLHKEGEVNCGNENDWLETALTTMGWANGIDAFCSVQPVAKSYKNNGTELGGKSDCKTGDKDFDMEEGSKQQVDNFKSAKGAMEDSAKYPYDPPGWLWYFIYKQNLEKFCGGGTPIKAGAGGTSYKSENAVSAHYIKLSTGGVERVDYQLKGKKDSDQIKNLYTSVESGGDWANGVVMTCAELAAATREYSGAFSTYMISYSNNEVARRLMAAIPTTGEGIDIVSRTAAIVTITACANKSNVKGVMEYSSSDPNDITTRFATIKRCAVLGLPEPYASLLAGLTPGGVEDVTPTDADPEANTCGIDGGLGWVLCPVINTVANLSDGMFNFLADNFLQVNSGYFDQSSTEGSAVFEAWSRFRDVANVAFVIAFLVIIYSQITGAGISNYGLKKMLPRLIFSAVLVNISFWICAIAVDVSNVVGFSIKNFIVSAGGPELAASIDDKAGFGWGNLATSVLLVGAGAALVWMNLAALIGFMGLSLIVLLIIVVILVVRQAAVILLIVIAPLAFVAFLLPNTQDWFTKWRKTFTAMLMLFPIIGIVFGASSLASTVIVSASGDNILQQILGKAVAILPLLAVPVLVKGSLSTLGAVGNRINGLGDKLGNKTSGKAQEKFNNTALMRGRGARKQARQQYGDRKYAQAVAGEDRSLIGRARARASKGALGRGILPSGKYAQGRVIGAAEIAADKHFDEDVKAAGLSYAGLSNAQVASISATGMHDGKKVGVEELAAAHDRIMSSGSFDERRKALEYAASQTGTGSAHDSASLRQRSVSGAMKRGDGNIYGVNFGNKLVDGRIKSNTDLAQEAVDNAAAGKVSAEHLVQSQGATDYLVDVARGATIVPGSSAAVGELKTAATEASTNSTTSKNVTKGIVDAFSRL